MSLLQIVCHPFDRSFTHALADRAEATASAILPVVRHDLYAEEFDPVLTGAEIARRFSSDDQVQRYSHELRTSHGYLFFHPDWWSGPPALLKGWIDRVMRPGIAYDWEGAEFEEKVHTPLLVGTRAAVFVTTDAEDTRTTDSIASFWSGVCTYAGIELQAVHTYTDLRNSSVRQRRAWLDEADGAVASFATEVFQAIAAKSAVRRDKGRNE